MTLDEAAKRHANSGWKTMDGAQVPEIDKVKWASFISGANWESEQLVNKIRKETGAGKELCEEAIRAMEKQHMAHYVDYIKRHSPKF